MKTKAKEIHEPPGVITYECSVCGGRVHQSVLACSPPIYEYRCSKCGRTKRASPTIVIVNLDE